MKRWTPYEVGIVLHFYISNERYPNDHAPAFVPTITSLVTAGILENTEESQSVFRVTERGKAWIESLLRTPLPVRYYIWTDPRTQKPVSDNHRFEMEAYGG